ncbi:MAG: hypothetical protein ACMUIP_07105 [bacterium]
MAPCPRPPKDHGNPPEMGVEENVAKSNEPLATERDHFIAGV